MSKLSTGRAIALLAALQFVYIVDFMMILPLGPDIAHTLGFSVAHVSWPAGAYTAAAVLSGLVAVRWLDRFDRRPALLTVFSLFSLATLSVTQVTNLETLIIARAMIGLFGAPAVALGMAILIDTVPPPQRGRAMGKVMIGFSLAAIVGVPMALELSRLGGWRTPFWCVAGVATLVWIFIAMVLPSMRGHMEQPRRVSPRTLLAQPTVRAACLMHGISQFSAFLVIPHFSPYFLLNLHFPREWLGALYAGGGLCALLTAQLIGRLIDRSGPLPPALLASGSILLGLTVFLWPGILPLALYFILFMAGNAARNVTLGTVTSQVPAPHERAGYMSLQNVVQDIAVTAGVLCSGLFLSVAPDGSLKGMSQVALLAMLALVAVLLALQRLRDRQAAPAATTGQQQA
ncbi:MFS transporter [Chitinivorax sp. B]|uniref:MFS transporter n=1 Tax=Chitinivorax sp. B TaxID=2502235 RepID=UPI0010F71D7B|nr:MFS transporter [Chitinivorax sp. B]